jgi:uncharacterized membrane protein YdbT with pleckstrin-like domain
MTRVPLNPLPVSLLAHAYAVPTPCHTMPSARREKREKEAQRRASRRLIFIDLISPLLPALITHSSLPFLDPKARQESKEYE